MHNNLKVCGGPDMCVESKFAHVDPEQTGRGKASDPEAVMTTDS